MENEEYFMTPEQDGNEFGKILGAAVISLFIVGLIIMLCSCGTTQRKFVAYADKHPDELTRLCGLRVPVKVQTKTDIKRIPGKPIKVPGPVRYVTADCDSARKAGVKVVRVPVPTYLQVDTVAITSEIERENTAAIDVMKQQNAKDLAAAQEKLSAADKSRMQTEVELENSNKRKNQFMWAAIAGWVIILGGAALKIFAGKIKGIGGLFKKA
jgi:hypothetical protein